jgi:hypothetical protein
VWHSFHFVLCSLCRVVNWIGCHCGKCHCLDSTIGTGRSTRCAREYDLCQFRTATFDLCRRAPRWIPLLQAEVAACVSFICSFGLPCSGVLGASFWERTRKRIQPLARISVPFPNCQRSQNDPVTARDWIYHRCHSIIMLQLKGLKKRASTMAKLITLMSSLAIIPSHSYVLRAWPRRGSWRSNK